MKPLKGKRARLAMCHDGSAVLGGEVAAVGSEWTAVVVVAVRDAVHSFVVRVSVGSQRAKRPCGR